ncbi:unnamed protein product [Closterium sp. Naga37s-1]|nr:unnamed protein product [Closterium sp. Naga37s-1]
MDCSAGRAGLPIVLVLLAAIPGRAAARMTDYPIPFTAERRLLVTDADAASQGKLLFIVLCGATVNLRAAILLHPTPAPCLPPRPPPRYFSCPFGCPRGNGEEAAPEGNLEGDVESGGRAAGGGGGLWARVDTLGPVSHPSLVRLVGWAEEVGRNMLVYNHPAPLLHPPALSPSPSPSSFFRRGGGSSAGGSKRTAAAAGAGAAAAAAAGAAGAAAGAAGAAAGGAAAAAGGASFVKASSFAASGDPPACLSFERRVDIAHSLAAALHHVHCCVEPPLVHRQVNSGNVLLQPLWPYSSAVSPTPPSLLSNPPYPSPLNPFPQLPPTSAHLPPTVPPPSPQRSPQARLANVGEVKGLAYAPTIHGRRNRAAYIDPEYFIALRASAASDVYSFGIILLELLTGQPAEQIDQATGRRAYLNIPALTALIRAHHLPPLLDPALPSPPTPAPSALQALASLAADCTVRYAKQRPDASAVLLQMEGIREAVQNGLTVQGRAGDHLSLSIPGSIAEAEARGRFGSRGGELVGGSGREWGSAGELSASQGSSGWGTGERSLGGGGSARERGGSGRSHGGSDRERGSGTSGGGSFSDGSSAYFYGEQPRGIVSSSSYPQALSSLAHQPPSPHPPPSPHVPASPHTPFKRHSLPRTHTAPLVSPSLLPTLPLFEAPHFSFHALQQATEDFAPHRVHRQAHLGEVYLGTIKTVGEVMVGELRHLVASVLGFTVTTEQCLFAFNHTDAPDLFHSLHLPAAQEPMGWQARAHVAYGVGEGLLQLHVCSHPHILHGALVSRNVLLPRGQPPQAMRFLRRVIPCYPGTPCAASRHTMCCFPAHHVLLPGTPCAASRHTMCCFPAHHVLLPGTPCAASRHTMCCFPAHHVLLPGTPCAASRHTMCCFPAHHVLLPGTPCAASRHTMCCFPAHHVLLPGTPCAASRHTMCCFPAHHVLLPGTPCAASRHTMCCFPAHHVLLPGTPCAASRHTMCCFPAHHVLLPGTPCAASRHTMCCFPAHHVLLPGTPCAASWSRLSLPAIPSAHLTLLLSPLFDFAMSHFPGRSLPHSLTPPFPPPLRQLFDFGMSHFAETRNDDFASPYCHAYMAPECATTGETDKTTDMYAYGVLLLELISGKLPYDDDRDPVQLSDWARQQDWSSSESIKELVDPLLEGMYNEDEVLMLASLAMRCLNEDKRERPTIKEVCNGHGGEDPCIRIVPHSPPPSIICHLLATPSPNGSLADSLSPSTFHVNFPSRASPPRPHVRLLPPHLCLPSVLTLPRVLSLALVLFNSPQPSSITHSSSPNPLRLLYTFYIMSEQVFNPDLTMSAAEEETLAESGDDLLVDDLPEGLIYDRVSSPDHPAAKKPCMDSGAGPANFNSPSTSSDSALAQPARSPVLPAAAAAPASPLQSPAPSLAATAAAPNAPALRAAAYAAVASGANPAPALPASLLPHPRLADPPAISAVRALPRPPRCSSPFATAW